MRGLWARGFSGEGLWGRGALLTTGEFETNTVRPDEALPEHLCGGMYRSRGRKRKAKKPAISYQEQKERRILKKFGANGVALGEDAEVKKKLEKGRTVSSKPRVAGSARGRELRAAAALARFDQNKKDKEKEEEQQKHEDDDDTATASEAESDFGDGSEDEYDAKPRPDDAVDIDGKRLLDAKGRGMVKICEDEDPGDLDARNELEELRGCTKVKVEGGDGRITAPSASSSTQPRKTTTKAPVKVRTENEPRQQQQRLPRLQDIPGRKTTTQNTLDSISKPTTMTPKPTPSKYLSAITTTTATTTTPTTTPTLPNSAANPPPRTDNSTPKPSNQTTTTCPICSFSNDNNLSPTCAMCANVLDLKNMPGAWACGSQTCQLSRYRNATDCGVCGVCGERRSSSAG